MPGWGVQDAGISWEDICDIEETDVLWTQWIPVQSGYLDLSQCL